MNRLDGVKDTYCRCGHSHDEHWWSGFVCHTCGCTMFKKPAHVR